jgi:hypothetical protein
MRFSMFAPEREEPSLQYTDAPSANWRIGLLQGADDKLRQTLWQHSKQ